MVPPQLRADSNPNIRTAPDQPETSDTESADPVHLPLLAGMPCILYRSSTRKRYTCHRFPHRCSDSSGTRQKAPFPNHSSIPE